MTLSRSCFDVRSASVFNIGDIASESRRDAERKWAKRKVNVADSECEAWGEFPGSAQTCG